MKISCIIPVYNEATRISSVLQIVAHHPLIKEVIVVDDASKDETIKVVEQFNGVKLIKHSVNKGKTQAIMTGVQATQGDWLLFLDADLVGLDIQCLTELIQPIISNLADVSMSLRKNSPWIDRVIGLDFISGERVLPKKLILDHSAEILKLPRFGLESFLNKLIIKNKYRLKVVFWKNVISPWKYQKYGWWAGVKGDYFMLRDILKTISVFEVLYQFIRMSLLKVK